MAEEGRERIYKIYEEMGSLHAEIDELNREFDRIDSQGRAERRQAQIGDAIERKSNRIAELEAEKEELERRLGQVQD